MKITSLLPVFAVASVLLALRLRAEPIVLEQIISREDSRFNCPRATLTVGRDGKVYLSCTSLLNKDRGFALRIGLDGKDKFSGEVVYAIANITANAKGVVASANAHFAHKVAIYDHRLQRGREPIEVQDFLVSDAVGWDSPSHVEAGVSGDFYGMDKHRNRILRISPLGKVVKIYQVPREPSGNQGLVEDFRVCEKARVFYVFTRANRIRCVGFDGKTRWQQSGSRAFDASDDGFLYVLPHMNDTIKRYSVQGKPQGTLKLQIGPHKPAPGRWFAALRLHGQSVVVRSDAHPTELFQCYDGKSGAFVRSAHIDHERFSVRFPRRTWTAGGSVPCTISFKTGGPRIRPRWRVWGRPLEAARYREFKLDAGALRVPADCSGLYRIKITPEVQPWERGVGARAPSEYLLQTMVEIRASGASGTISAYTAENRVHYGQGERIGFSILARGRSTPAVVRLAYGGSSVGQTTINLRSGAPTSLVIPAHVSAALRPGRYSIAASAPGMTSVPQPLVIGPGMLKNRFFQVQYGDYGPMYPGEFSYGRCPYWIAADVAAAHVERVRKLGLNLIVDRLGFPTQMGDLWWGGQHRHELDQLVKRLESDPRGVAPQKARILSPLQQVLAGYSASGINQMAILMGNDAGLPLGEGYDRRKPEKLTQDLKKIMQGVGRYPCFRGWSWSSNWWVFGKRGANAAKSPQQKAAYEAALKRANQTGAWSQVLDEVANRRLGFAVTAQGLFNRTLNSIAPGKHYVTASAAPYRNVESYPPITFSNVDEVDLHIQWEQMGVPYNAPHNVDFYKRPGKRGWAHPEIWNDDGTGGQVLPTLFMSAMRGADGVGCSGVIPPWAGGPGGLPDDPRTPHYGSASVYRALYALLRQYGPMLSALENDDRVAIMASGRMYKTDHWKHTTGLHFARQFEAYMSCLHAHHPASIVFAEDLKPNTLKRFKAVLVVDQRIEMEPRLKKALSAAANSGVAIFYDGTCRPRLVRGFRPLGISFNKVENDRSPAGDDAAYWRYAAYAKANVPALAKALNAVVRPAAAIDDDQILISQRKNGQARYLWVVNNTMPRIDPGHIWRMTLAVTSRVPVVVPVRLKTSGKAIYDVFAMQRVTPINGTVKADLRCLPGRLYAILPAPIRAVSLSGPQKAQAGQRLRWRVQALAAGNKPVAGVVPIRVRLLAADGSTLAERFTAATARPAAGVFVAPLNAPRGKLKLEAVELFSGKSASVSIAISPAVGAVFSAGNSAVPKARPAAPPAKTVRGSARSKAASADSRFGPHIRDLVIVPAGRGKFAVVNTMNWDHNLYAVDLKTGKTKWRQRVGHYFAFSPKALTNGIAVEGFDFESAAGYHLYLVGNKGQAQRRFALYGLPGRLPHRFVPGILRDRLNNFAVPPNGRWVAAAGDLGLVVWSRTGKQLWRRDFFGKKKRHTAKLAAIGNDLLLVAEGVKITARSAADGKPRWRLKLAESGEVLRVRTSKDGRTIALLATSLNGRVFILRRGKLLRAFPTPGSDLTLASDGSRLLVVHGNQLKCYSITDGLQWTFAGDDRLRSPSFAGDDMRIVTASDIGTVYVLDRTGSVLWEKDMRARAVPRWLADGGLVLGTWAGVVCRLDKDYKARWRIQLRPSKTDMRDKLLAPDGAPTTRVTAWSNAARRPLPMTPNLLRGIPVKMEFVPTGTWGGRATFARDPKPLYDGKNQPPPAPWVDWSYVGFFAETSPVNYVQIDTGNKKLQVTGITLFEDPEHPESWLRDARFDYWDPGKNIWIPVQPLLSNAPVHTHKFAKPVAASKFRIFLPWGVVGNLRLAEIVLHGVAP